MLISAESGKSDTKYFDGVKFGKFHTRLSMNEDVIAGVDRNCNNIIFEDKLYKIGDTAGESNFEVSKNRLIHKLSILNSCCILNKYNESNFKVVTGTPVRLFFSEERENIRKNLVGDYRILFNKEVKNFRIDNVLVIPEGMGYIYQNYNKVGKGLTRVVDIGGLNTNGCIYEDGLPIRETNFTINMGINIVINKIVNDLNREGFNYQAYEIPHLLKNCGDYEEDIIRDVLDKHIIDLIQAMRVNNWNIDNQEIHFTGGGSIVLNEYIKERFPKNVISSDGVYDNAKGFYKVGESLC